VANDRGTSWLVRMDIRLVVNRPGRRRPRDWRAMGVFAACGANQLAAVGWLLEHRYNEKPLIVEPPGPALS
jgi:hypothetical protein